MSFNEVIQCSCFPYFRVLYKVRWLRGYKCPPAMWKTQVQSLGWEDPLRRKWKPTPVLLIGKFHGQRSLVGYSPWDHEELHRTEPLLGFPCGSAGKESACNVGDMGSIPGWEDPVEKGKGTHSSILSWRIPWTV